MKPLKQTTVDSKMIFELRFDLKLPIPSKEPVKSENLLKYSGACHQQSTGVICLL